MTRKTTKNLLAPLVLILELMLGMLSLQSCDAPEPVKPDPNDTVDPYASLKLDTFDCDIPVGFGSGLGPRIPASRHVSMSLSGDGKQMAYLSTGQLRVIELTTNADRSVSVAECLDYNERVVEVFNVLWCPYDNAQLLVECIVSADTNRDGSFETTGQQLYIAAIDGRACRRVTPSMYGRYGARGGIYVSAWLPGSRAGVDSLLGTFEGTPEQPNAIRGVFIPQREQFVADVHPNLISVSRDGSQWLEWRPKPFDPVMYLYLNGRPLVLPDNSNYISFRSWSPDGKKLALTARRIVPDDSVQAGHYDDIWEQVWIVDVDRYMREGWAVAPTQVIHMQKRFCTYSHWGIYATFISNRTLAVSMHKDGDPASLIWEITTDGRVVRQLTTKP